MLGWEFPPFFSGGLGTHCFFLTHTLSKLNIKIDFYLPSNKNLLKPKKINNNLTLIPITLLNKFSPYPQKHSQSSPFSSNVINYNNSLFTMLSKNIKKYDLIHAHDWLTAPSAIKLKKHFKIPYVQTIHATEFDRTSSPWDFIVQIEKNAVEQADLIIAVSKMTKNTISEKYSITKDKIQVVYNGLFYEKKQQHQKTYFSHLKNKRIVLFFGRITEQKGPFYFIKAAKKVLKNNKDVHFVMAGTGDSLPSTISKVISLNMLDNFTFTGFITQEERDFLYNIADVYVLSSTSEPFGITVLEAAAFNTPVVLTKTSGVSEVLKSALITDFWDIEKMAFLINGVLNYKQLHNFLKKEAKKEVEKLTWDEVALETIKVYKKALGE